MLQFSHLELYLAGSTFILFLILLLYCFVFYDLPRRKEEERKQAIKQEAIPLPPVSIVVYSRDQAERIRLHLPILLAQDYPEDYEVIVVNDGVSEECAHELSLLKERHERLYYTYISKETRYISKKKLALTLGIKAARHERILFTEMDCEPRGNQWLQSMVKSYRAETDLVLGCCAYPHTKGWRNKFIAFDNLKNNLQYLSASLLGVPFSGTGKNLSYTKHLFFAHKGFYDHLYLKIGEDNLFVNETAHKENTEICYSPESILSMDEVYRLKQWTQERKARLSIRGLYKKHFYRWFQAESISLCLFWISIISSIVVGLLGNTLLTLLAGICLLAYYSIKSWIFINSAKLLQQKISISEFLILDGINTFYLFYVEILSQFSKKENHVFLIK